MLETTQKSYASRLIVEIKSIEKQIIELAEAIGYQNRMLLPYQDLDEYLKKLRTKMNTKTTELLTYR